MDIEKFKAEWGELGTVFISGFQYFNDGSLVLYLTEDGNDRKLRHRILCTGVLGFHDRGLVGKEVTYFDINELAGVKYWFYAQQVGLYPKDYIELVLTDGLHYDKRELIIACKDAFIDNK